MKKNRFEKRAACFCLACFRVLLSESLAEAKFTRRRQFSPLLTRISVDSLSPGGGTPSVKVTGMLAVSRLGVICRFWSHLGCL